jgi:hypothetical protein
VAEGSSCLRQIESHVRKRGSDTYRVDCRATLIVGYSQLTINCCGRPAVIARRVGVAFVDGLLGRPFQGSEVMGTVYQGLRSSLARLTSPLAKYGRPIRG